MARSNEDIDEEGTSGTEDPEQERVSLKPPEERKEELEEELVDLRSDLARLVDRIDASRPPSTPDAVATAPQVPKSFEQAEDLLRAIEEEVAHVDLLLAEVARHERGLRLQGFQELGEPFHSAEFTLYARLVPRKGLEPLVKYFFAEEPPLNAVPVPLPDGYEVEVEAKSGRRALKRSKSKPIDKGAA